MNPSIKPALELDKTSLNFTLELRPSEARFFASKCTGHGISPDNLRRMIKEIDGFLPRMNFGMLNGRQNPNNGHAFHTYTIGKEYSRVLYLNAPKLYAKDFNWDNLTRTLRALASQYDCDEFDVEQDTDVSYLIRFWWD